MQILIAEDDAVSRRLLQILLEKLGHEVRVAEEGTQAWKLFDENPVRIVVSDWMMPGFSGLDLCRKIRNRAETDYTYFILLTARAGKQDYLAAMELGIDDFLAKPLDQAELAIRLRVAERILQFTSQIRLLKELLPICSYCKKIRDDADYWHEIETYIGKQTGSDFSHGVCPSCFEKVIAPQIEELKRKTAKSNTASSREASS